MIKSWPPHRHLVVSKGDNRPHSFTESYLRKQPTRPCCPKENPFSSPLHYMPEACHVFFWAPVLCPGHRVTRSPKVPSSISSHKLNSFELLHLASLRRPRTGQRSAVAWLGLLHPVQDSSFSLASPKMAANIKVWNDSAQAAAAISGFLK